MNTVRSSKSEGYRRAPIERLLSPFNDFIQKSASGGIVLIIFTALALVWANSPWAETYHAIWSSILTIGPNEARISKPLILWINDGLMAIFFFVVGLEIKREALVGELASLKKAALPIAGALGGIDLPAAIYSAVNAGSPSAGGWGIPMATDIAFALGILALLGSRVPLSLKVFLAALAIVDDIGAVLVIALFYTESVATGYLYVGGGLLLVLIALNALGVRNGIPYLLFSVLLWVCILKSGIHATVAGVLAAMTIPARTRINAKLFGDRASEHLSVFTAERASEESVLTNSDQRKSIYSLERLCEQAGSPLLRIEHSLHPWIAFVVMPIFALANAGVLIGAGAGEALMSEVSIGIILGLIAGKQIGVFGFSWLAVKLGFASLPADVTWKQIYGAGALAGIGFTMSLFITGLAFQDEAIITSAKLGILVASLISGIIGFLVIRSCLNTSAETQATA